MLVLLWLHFVVVVVDVIVGSLVCVVVACAGLPFSFHSKCSLVVLKNREEKGEDSV